MGVDGSYSEKEGSRNRWYFKVKEVDFVHFKENEVRIP